jgi:hypothetical protein
MWEKSFCIYIYACLGIQIFFQVSMIQILRGCTVGLTYSIGYGINCARKYGHKLISDHAMVFYIVPSLGFL